MSPEGRRLFDVMQKIHEEYSKLGKSKEEFCRRCEETIGGPHAYMDALIYLSKVRERHQKG